MEKIFLTFNGKRISECAITHQQLSNRIWYNRIIFGLAGDTDELEVLEERFNNVLLAYRPSVDYVFHFEIDVLRELGYLQRDLENDCRVVIVRDGKEIGEIIANGKNERESIIFGERPHGVIEGEGIKQGIPYCSKTCIKSYKEIWRIYKDEVACRPMLKRHFAEALEGIDEEIAKKADRENNREFCKMGILLRRKDHPLNVYTVQCDHKDRVAIFNITHGQWWGNSISIIEMKKPFDRIVSVAEFKRMCGTVDMNEFYLFDEANRLIKK